MQFCEPYEMCIRNPFKIMTLPKEQRVVVIAWLKKMRAALK